LYVNHEKQDQTSFALTFDNNVTETCSDILQIKPKDWKTFYGQFP